MGRCCRMGSRRPLASPIPEPPPTHLPLQSLNPPGLAPPHLRPPPPPPPPPPLQGGKHHGVRAAPHCLEVQCAACRGVARGGARGPASHAAQTGRERADAAAAILYPPCCSSLPFNCSPLLAHCFSLICFTVTRTQLALESHYTGMQPQVHSRSNLGAARQLRLDHRDALAHTAAALHSAAASASCVRSWRRSSVVVLSTAQRTWASALACGFRRGGLGVGAQCQQACIARDPAQPIAWPLRRCVPSRSPSAPQRPPPA